MVSARTYQVLYIIKALTLDGELPTVASIRKYIDARRMQTPHLCRKVYIAPSALSDLLNRMEGGFIFQDEPSNSWELNSIGEGMVSLFYFAAYQDDGSGKTTSVSKLDACTDDFIDNYKERVTLAAAWRLLDKRLEVSAQEIANLCELSVDSVRAGCATLVNEGKLIEITDGRLKFYALPTTSAVKEAEEAVEIATPEAPIIDALEEAPSSELEDVLIRVDFDRIFGEDEVQPVRTDRQVDLSSILEMERGENQRITTAWTDVPVDIQRGWLTLADAAGVSLEQVLRVQMDRGQERLRRVLGLIED